VETFNTEILAVYGQACGWVLARAHAKAEEIAASINGYLGSSSGAFDAAMGEIRIGLCGSNERDHAALKAAVRKWQGCRERRIVGSARTRKRAR
jgi:hypothetical protein